jgi:RNA polymerase sigma-70 factor (ECF subfamily)
MSHSANGHFSADDFAQKLKSAKNGSMDSLGQLLDACRQYLLLIANQELNPELTAKVGASDLVQETFLAAGRDFSQFRGATQAELLGWLRQVLVNHLLATQRRYIEARKRNARREISLNDCIDLAADALPASTLSPSNLLMCGELATLVENALTCLPHHYQQVIDLRHKQALNFDDVAHRLGTTSQAARKLWARAIKRLQKELFLVR